MIVSQPLKVISELLPADQRVEEVGDHEHRHDQPEEVGRAHVRDEGAEERLGTHTRSIPSIIAQQDGEHDDPEHDCKDVHAVNLERPSSRPHDDPRRRITIS